MNRAPKILAVIPARGGSKGIPRKNIMPLAGKPLISYAITTALDSGVIDKLVVSTEDQEIAHVAKAYGADVIQRPEEFASDTALTEPVMEHALMELEASGYKPDFIALIQCTSPLLSSDVIRQAVDMVTSGSADSAVTLFYPEGYEFKWTLGEGGVFVPDHDVEKRPRRQDLNLPYHENGAFYITRTDLFKKTKNRFGGNLAKIGGVLMSETESIQIDSAHHVLLIETLLRQGKNPDHKQKRD